MIAFTTRVVSRRVFILATLLVASLFITHTVQASEACGNIIEPEDIDEIDSSIISTPIADCADPFLVTDPVSPYQLVINGKLYTNNAIVVLPSGETNDISVSGTPSLTGYNLKLYKHDGADFKFVPIYASDTTRSDYATYAESYFPNQSDRDFYMEVWDVMNEFNQADEYFYDSEGNEKVDAETGQFISDRYFNFVDSYEKSNPMIDEGTYTLLITEFLLFQTQNTVLQRFARLLIPIAHAQSNDSSDYRYTITFTITKEAPVPQGASSVLFLPGIQASRLYTDGLVGTEDQLWTPNWNQDVHQLRMTEAGESVEEVYTRDILDEVIGLGTVYKSFASSLDVLVTDKTIVDWQPFAYDWRHAVDDVATNGTQYENEVRNALTVLEELANDSYSKKVTIVAHSNGGLLAKSLLTRLQEQGKEHLVDRLILLASPQLGTPKAVGSLLHGFDQSAGGGIIIDAAVARNAIRNMPGVYGLLPTEEYFSASGVPLINFAEGDSLQLFRNTYGDTIDTISELHSFITGAGDGRENAVTVYDALKANSAVLQDSITLHNDILQSWHASSAIEVIEVVGVGLPTVSGFEYREFKKRECTTTLFTESCADVAYYKPVPIFSLFGDETVMAQSAKGYKGDKKTYYFDLYGQGQEIEFKHVNFSEAPAIQELVTKSIKDESLDTIPFITMSAVVQTNEYQLLSVNSPATIVVLDDVGNKTDIDYSDGELMVKHEGIIGSSIYYMGSTTYIVLPAGKTYSFNITGTGSGGVTVVLDSINNDILVTKNKIYIPDTLQGMKIAGSIKNDQVSPLMVDITNDGVIDYSIDPKTGERIIENNVIINNSSKQNTATKVRHNPVGTVAGLGTTNIEEYYRKLFQLLLLLQKIIHLYEK